MNKGLKQTVCNLSILLLSTMLVLMAANAQAGEVGRKSTISPLSCAWSECWSCSQYRHLCQSRRHGEDAVLKSTVKTGETDITAAQASEDRNAKRYSNLYISFSSFAEMSDQAKAADLPDPSPVQISKDSPFGPLEACGNFPGIFDGTNFTDSEVEPWIEVNPTDPDNIVAIWQQDRWSDGGSRGNVAGVSFDGGASWQIVPIPGVTDCTGGPWERASNPRVSFGPNGTVHHMSLVFQTDPPLDRVGGFGPNAMMVSKSTDGGLTWSDPFTLIEDDNPRILNDMNSLTADPTDANFVYAVWDRLQITSAEAIAPENVRPGQGLALGIGLEFKASIYFARSTDGGDTWEPARKIYDPGANDRTIGNQIVVLPDGTVIDFFSELLNVENSDQNGPGFNFDLSLLRSTDKGETWQPRGRPIRAATIISNGAVTPDDGEPVRDASILFDVAVDPVNGNLYAVWQDIRFNGIEEVAFSMSSDGGLTWSQPIKVNQTPANKGNPLRAQAFLPSIAVADDGVLAVTYYDFRNDIDPTGGELTDYFAVHCEFDCNYPANWGNEIRLTDTSFDYLDAPFARGQFLGDYEGLASDGLNFLPAFGITSPTDPASIFFRRFSPQRPIGVHFEK